MEKVSKIASRIYQSAKAACKGCWDYRSQWSRAMKAAWKQILNTVKEAIMGLSIFQAAEAGHIIGVKHKDLHYNFGSPGTQKFIDTPMPCYAGDILSAQHAATDKTIEVTVESIEAHHSDIYAKVIMGGKSQLWDICRIAKMISDGICTVR